MSCLFLLCFPRSVKMSRPNAGSHKPNRSSSKQSDSLRSKGLKDIRIDEEVKIAVNIALERFQYSEETEMEFPSSFTNSERAFVHRLAQSLGYISKSRGKGSNRFLTIWKKDGSEAAQSIMTFSFTANSKHVVRNLLQRFPITSKERTDLLPRTDRGLSLSLETDKNRTNGRLQKGLPQVPQRRGPSELESFRRTLPVYERQEEIVATIKENQVVLVVGETGSGKTTQIPQFLLDDSYQKGIPCRIFCTQPRRLAAIAVAERVAAERGESIGQTVGYQIRLESRVSPKTLLTFCTSGVLLRTLMSGDATLSTVTHVIVDEVHERDGLTDFLLTKMRDMLQKMPSLKLILSSAALDVDLFIRYFGKCPIIHIKGRPYDVKPLYLEDILRTTSYMNKDMVRYKKEMQKEEKQQTSLTEWCEVKEGVSRPEPQRDRRPACVLQENDLLYDGGDSVFSQLVILQLAYLLNLFGISLDYRHSETSATALMVAAGRGFICQTEQLLSMGANVHIKASNGWTALDWAKHFNQTEAVDLLESHISSLEAGQLDESSLLQSSSGELSAEDQELLKAYHHSFDDEKVDLDLIMHLLYSICQSSDEGAVLIFLPGYDEIVGLRDRILFDDKRFAEHQHRYQVFTLHSNMQTSDQRKVLKPAPSGVRKIILSTNIAETSITVNDVVFVIDSGKVKEKAFDALNHVTMLKMVWISKASALQRKGRYVSQIVLLYNLSNILDKHCELCLHTKLLAPIDCSIAEFLSKAPEPPHLMTVKNAVQMLKTIDAMDPWEDLTELGYHLADLPVEPHLGKMVLCAVVLKCLDPILTIACTLAYRDPFVLPAQASQKRAAMLCRKRFAANTFSDHMALLRAFQVDDHLINDFITAVLHLSDLLILHFTTKTETYSPSKQWSQLDEATIRTLVSVLSAEEQVTGLQQPTGIGQRPKPMPSDKSPPRSTWKSTNSRRGFMESELDEEALSSCCFSLYGLEHYSNRAIIHCIPVTLPLHYFTTDSLIHFKKQKIQCSKSPPQRPPAPVRYFIMKSSNMRNIELSQQRSIWSTTPNNEHKLNRAFQESSMVFLIFSVQGSGHFQVCFYCLTKMQIFLTFAKTMNKIKSSSMFRNTSTYYYGSTTD
uniref:RNA helicase n=1 Tax=Astyanax mexicanus TaxID=7994 RepID=A0A8B9HP93_ASTMX